MCPDGVQLVSEVTDWTAPVEGVPENDDRTNYTGVTYYGDVNVTVLLVGYNKLHVVLYGEDNQVSGAPDYKA